MVGAVGAKTTGIVLDVARQRGGAMPDAATLYDHSRFGSDGAIIGAVWVQIPKGLWVLDFDPTIPSRIGIPFADCPQLDFISEDFSLVSRVNIDSLADYRGIFFRGLYQTDGYEWRVDQTTGRPHFRTNQTPPAAQFSDANPILINTWYTLGVSRSGNSVRLYTNGLDTTLTVGVHINPTTCIVDATIGYDVRGARYPFDGRIALVRIFSYALSAGQHLQMHEALER